MRYKNIANHPEFSKQAKKTDDLKAALIYYGASLSPDALKAVQADYKRAEIKIQRLCKVLDKQGYREFL